MATVVRYQTRPPVHCDKRDMSVSTSDNMLPMYRHRHTPHKGSCKAAIPPRIQRRLQLCVQRRLHQRSSTTVLCVAQPVCQHAVRGAPAL